jgi:hypothetical protein
MHVQQVFFLGDDHHVEDRQEEYYPAKRIPGRPEPGKADGGEEVLSRSQPP